MYTDRENEFCLRLKKILFRMKKWILVTGCDSGFGKDVVERILTDQRGFGIIACYHQCPFPDTRGVVSIQLDITSNQSVVNMVRVVEQVLEQSKGTLCRLVNNAGGLCVAGPIEWGTIESDMEQMDLNFFGHVRVTRALLPFLRKSSLTCFPRIVFTSSLMGCVAAPFGGSYVASKFALEGWCDSLRREMLAFGISVHVVQPGVFHGTNFYNQYEKLVPPPVEGYGSRYRAYCVERLVTLRNFFGNLNTNWRVSGAIVHALTSPWPKHRYRVGYDSVVVGLLFHIIPSTLADLAITICDPLIFLSARMVPASPESSRFKSWTSIAAFALSSYSQYWIMTVLFIIAVVLSSF